MGAALCEMAGEGDPRASDGEPDTDTDAVRDPERTGEADDAGEHERPAKVLGGTSHA